MNDTLIALASTALYLSALALKGWWIYRNSVRTDSLCDDNACNTDHGSSPQS